MMKLKLDERKMNEKFIKGFTVKFCGKLVDLTFLLIPYNHVNSENHTENMFLLTTHQTT